jgi:hypothetical protein
VNRSFMTVIIPKDQSGLAEKPPRECCLPEITCQMAELAQAGGEISRIVRRVGFDRPSTSYGFPIGGVWR